MDPISSVHGLNLPSYSQFLLVKSSFLPVKFQLCSLTSPFCCRKFRIFPSDFPQFWSDAQFCGWCSQSFSQVLFAKSPLYCGHPDPRPPRPARSPPSRARPDAPWAVPGRAPSGSWSTPPPPPAGCMPGPEVSAKRKGQAAKTEQTSN